MQTNLWKVFLIAFDAYLNFFKISNISKIYPEPSIKFQEVFCKICTNIIHDLPRGLKNFFKDFQNFRQIFPNIPLIFEGRFEKTQYILNSIFGFYIKCQKKYKIQSKNIIMCCEFDAKLHLDPQNIKQFWYRASASEFLLIARTHLTTHGHINSSTHIWYLECWRSSSH